MSEIEVPGGRLIYTSGGTHQGVISGLMQPPNPYARLSDIAPRLGVKPYSAGPATVLVPGRDGEQYDLFEVIERLLDRLADAIAKASQP